MQNKRVWNQYKEEVTNSLHTAEYLIQSFFLFILRFAVYCEVDSREIRSLFLFSTKNRLEVITFFYTLSSHKVKTIGALYNCYWHKVVRFLSFVCFHSMFHVPRMMLISLSLSLYPPQNWSLLFGVFANSRKKAHEFHIGTEPFDDRWKLYC